ncbi:MAG: hypothetical protein PHD39_13560, partial [Methylobacter tundripaludum]|nr:hypothetical protein [Methylobacter tundripaludum]
IDSIFISRAATFTFFLGDRFFGVITAYVAGPDAEKYHLTSSLPVQIIKFLEPTLAPLVNKTAGGDASGLLVNLKTAETGKGNGPAFVSPL